MTFNQLFILACFKSEQTMRTTTLYHLLKGKRTSSILSYGHFYQCLMYFALFPKLEEKSYQKIIKMLISENYIMEIGEGYVAITSSGKKLLSKSDFPAQTHLNQLAFYKWDMSLFERIVFTTQVLSEKAHENSDYLPIETNIFKQQQLKRWLKKQNKEITTYFYNEWDQLIDEIPKESHELILGQLVGFNQIGLTLNQIADKEKRDCLYNYLEFKNTWHQMIQIILADKTRYPLFNELLLEEMKLKKEDSSRYSGDLYQEGFSIEEIAKKRNLKISTVTDHLIEEYIITQDVNRIPAFSVEIKKQMVKLRETHPLYLKWTYQEVLSYCPTLSFYEFKFYQFYLMTEEKKDE